MTRKEEILRAARKCMREKGFHNASVQSIAREAGVSTGLIYRYYKSKAEIIEILIIDAVDNLKELLTETHSQSKTDIFSPDFVFAEKRSFIDNAQESISLLLEVSAEARRNPCYQSLFTAAYEELKNNVYQREAERNPDISESALRTRLYFSSLLIDGLVIRRLRLGEETNNEADKIAMRFLNVMTASQNR
ncbi:TetR/AcrR family transcriptional regulator [Rahnella sp. PCH160]|uniref:TetR/AcrR family transcriptional regulator n=1 Tax=Rahnella sp. PCH160 TaxID=3447928 RepID=UPI0039FCCECF